MNPSFTSLIILSLGISFSAFAQSPPEKPTKSKPPADGTASPPIPPDKPATPPPPSSDSDKKKSNKKDKSDKPKDKDKDKEKNKDHRDEPDRKGPSIVVKPGSIVIPGVGIRIGPAVPQPPRPLPRPVATRSCGSGRAHAAHDFRGRGGVLLHCPGVGGRPVPLRRP